MSSRSEKNLGIRKTEPFPEEFEVKPNRIYQVYSLLQPANSTTDDKGMVEGGKYVKHLKSKTNLQVKRVSKSGGKVLQPQPHKHPTQGGEKRSV